MLMGHPSIQEAHSFKKILNLISRASGLAVNPNKYQFFIMNTAPIVHRNIIRILGFTRGVIPSKYLGIPLGMVKFKKSSWEDLLDKMKQILSTWVFRTLNNPSRMVLVKGVLHSMLIYPFSVLSTQKSVLHEI